MCIRKTYLLLAVRARLFCFLCLFIGSGFGLSSAHAQQRSRPLFDGLTISPGLSIYIGDLDGNPENNPIKYLASGQFGFMIAGDRRYGRASVGLELHYDHIQVAREPFALSNNIISLDLVGGYHFDLVRSDLFCVAGGVGATLLMPRYEGYSEAVEGVRKDGTRPVITFPLSLIIQQRVRVGLRLTLTDFMDGFEGTGGHIDLLSFVNIGYRFNFAR